MANVLNDLSIPYVINSAYLVMEEKANLKNLIRNKEIKGDYTDSASFPRMVDSDVTVTTVTKAQDIIADDISDASVTIQATEKGVSLIIRDSDAEDVSENLSQWAGIILGNKFNDKIEYDIWQILAGFSANTVGSTGTAMSSVLYRQAKSKIRKANPSNIKNLLCLQSVQSEEDMLNTLTLNVAAATNIPVQIPEIFKENIFKSGSIEGNMLFGVPYVISNIVADDTNGDHILGMFDRNTLGFVIKRDMRIEMQRDASARTTELVATMRYGVGIIYEPWGCKITVDGDANS